MEEDRIGMYFYSSDGYKYCVGRLKHKPYSRNIGFWLHKIWKMWFLWLEILIPIGKYPQSMKKRLHQKDIK